MSYFTERISLNEAYDIIKENDLNINDTVDFTIGLFKGNKLIGTGSLYNNIIKLVAISKQSQSDNLLSLIITGLISELTKRNISKYFIYTKESMKKYFISLGFIEIVSYGGVSYLENNSYPLKEKLTDTYKSLNIEKDDTAAIIMNCNPITNGHLYLIETVSKLHEHVIVFLVSEDRSFFSYEIRYKLVSSAIKHLDNVTVLPSTNYLISELTFPTYFLKDLNEISKIQMHLDVLIFKNYFMPLFNIKKRYVGTEDVDLFTKEYNNVLKFYLKDNLIVINRLKHKDKFISASLVRKYIKEGKYDLIKNIVPITTYEFIVSEEGKKLLNEG